MIHHTNAMAYIIPSCNHLICSHLYGNFWSSSKSSPPTMCVSDGAGPLLLITKCALLLPLAGAHTPVHKIQSLQKIQNTRYRIQNTIYIQMHRVCLLQNLQALLFPLRPEATTPLYNALPNTRIQTLKDETYNFTQSNDDKNVSQF